MYPRPERFFRIPGSVISPASLLHYSLPSRPPNDPSQRDAFMRKLTFVPKLYGASLIRLKIVPERADSVEDSFPRGYLFISGNNRVHVSSG